MKRAAASKQTVMIPLIPRLAVVQVDLTVIGIAPQVQRIRNAVRVACAQCAI